MKVNINASSFVGTYQIGNNANFDNMQYLSLLPKTSDSENQNGEAYEYDIDNNIIFTGTYEMKHNYAVVYSGENKAELTVFIDESKYYLVNTSIEPVALTKISNEPFTPEK